MLKWPKSLNLLKTVHSNKEFGSPGTPPLRGIGWPFVHFPAYPISYRQFHILTIQKEGYRT